MRLESVEKWARGSAALEFLVLTVVELAGVRRAWQRPKGRVAGRGPAILPVLVLAFGMLVDLAVFVRLYRPLPVRLSRPLRVLALVVGSVLYTAGVGLILWGRFALGEMYYVSTAFGAQLFAGHRLVTSGPYALVRHPMYAGATLWALGGTLLFRTWGFLVLLAAVPAVLFVRARREEEALAAEFGEEWRAYARRVPAGISVLRH